MARVIPDLIDGEVRLSANGDTARRLFRVLELSGAPSARLVEAASVAGIPRVGDAHPSMGGVRVSDVRASATGDPTIAVTEVTYTLPASSVSAINGATEVSILSDLYTEETLEDVNGRRIETTFVSTGTSGSGGGSFSTSVSKQAHRMEVQRPTFSVQYSRLEASPPLNVARTYAGKVNANGFLNEPADRWLCNIESSQVRADQHRVRYTFTLNQSGWQARITHNSAGIIPVEASTANGIETVQVYNRVNFGALRLPAI